MATTVWVRPFNGSWQPIGGGVDRGVWHEGLVAVSNQWGPLSAQFTLKRQPRAMFPDLLTHTPVIVEEGGVRVWRGRIKDGPEQSGPVRQITVQCVGGQAAADDDQLERILVHNDLAGYKDSRSLLAANLATITQVWQVASDSGVISIGVPNGAVVASGSIGGVTLDLGPASTAKRVVITADSSNNAPAVSCRMRGSSSDDAATAGEDSSFALNVGTPVSAAATFTTARRYVHIHLTATAGFTAGADIYVKLRTSQVFADTAYESGSASVLSAKTIILDALARTNAANVLHPDRSGIGDPAFSFPNFAPGNAMTTRELIAAANAPIGWRFKIDENLRPIYQALATIPVIDLGAWIGNQGDSGSSNSDEGITTTVVVTGTGPDGAPVRSVRTQTGTVVDRQGDVATTSLTTNYKLNSTFADKLGDTYLAAHRVSPFKGQHDLAFYGARRTSSGIPVRPAHMLLLTSELARRTDLVDPDTGALGRTAVIDQVTYRDDDQTAAVDLDNTRRDFEALNERLGLLVPS